MVLLKNHDPMTVFDTNYKCSPKVHKQISDKAFDVQDSTGKVRHVSKQHL